MAKTKEYWTVEEYLEFETNSPIRHEYVDGQIYAMVGESKNHNRIALDLATRLNDHLAGGNCEAFIEGIKVRVRPTLFYYPDVVVTCSELIDDADEDEYIIDKPVLIVEVLSKSTTRIDRKEKMSEYQALSTLKEYVIIAQDKTRVEVYRHQAANEPWNDTVYSEPGEEAYFDSVGLRVILSEIYRRVIFPETEINEKD